MRLSTNNSFNANDMNISGLVPARFLTLTAHLILTVAIFWSREANVKAGLPIIHTKDQYDSQDTKFAVALGLTLVCLGLEYFGFFGGISTFMASMGIISTCVHGSACVCLAFFVWDVWDCELYWWIFGWCAALPAAAEIALLVGVFGLNKTF